VNPGRGWRSAVDLDAAARLPGKLCMVGTLLVRREAVRKLPGDRLGAPRTGLEVSSGLLD
jgi:hypothetical protein